MVRSSQILLAISALLMSSIVMAQSSAVPSPLSKSYDAENVHLKAGETPKGLENVGIKENLGTELDLSLKFTNAKGEIKTLGDYINGEKPVILSLVYYTCPNLCNYHLNGLIEGLRKLKWTAGEEFDVVAVSFDHKEKADVALPKKQNYMKAYGRAGAEKGWHFLTGDKASVDALAKSVGFSFRFDQETKEWAHSSAAIMVSPKGKVSRYLHGVFFEEKDLRLALLEATQGKVGDLIDSVILYCFKFNPKKNKYTLYAFNLMRAGATATVVLMGLFLIPFWIRQKRNPRT